KIFSLSSMSLAGRSLGMLIGMSGLAGNQRLSDVVDDVLRVFQTDRETDEILVDTGLFQLFIAELAVGVAGRMQQAGTGIRHMGGDDRQLQGIHELFGLLPAALQGEGEHAAGALWAVFLRKRMIAVVFQSGIADP